VTDLRLDDERLWDLAAEVIGKGGLFEFRARGYSMYPCIADGDRVKLGPLAASGPALGEIVLARSASGLRLHRVVAQGKCLRLRGDAQPGPGEEIGHGNVCGRVLAVQVSPLQRCLRRLRTLLRRLNTWIHRS